MRWLPGGGVGGPADRCPNHRHRCRGPARSPGRRAAGRPRRPRDGARRGVRGRAGGRRRRGSRDFTRLRRRDHRPGPCPPDRHDRPRRSTMGAAAELVGTEPVSTSSPRCDSTAAAADPATAVLVVRHGVLDQGVPGVEPAARLHPESEAWKPGHGTLSGSLIEAEGYVRDLATTNPNLSASIMRLANLACRGADDPLPALLASPIVPADHLGRQPRRLLRASRRSIREALQGLHRALRPVRLGADLGCPAGPYPGDVSASKPFQDCRRGEGKRSETHAARGGEEHNLSAVRRRRPTGPPGTSLARRDARKECVGAGGIADGGGWRTQRQQSAVSLQKPDRGLAGRPVRATETIGGEDEKSTFGSAVRRAVRRLRSRSNSPPSRCGSSPASRRAAPPTRWRACWPRS